MRWLCVLVLFACEHPTKSEAAPRKGTVRGFVSGGGNSPVPPGGWIERGALEGMRVTIEDIAVVGNDHVAVTNDQGRYGRALKPGEYRLRIDAPAARCTPDFKGPDENTALVVVKPGKTVDVKWRCQFMYK